MISRLKNKIKGTTAIEYGLIASLVAVAIIVSLKFLGTGLNNTFLHVASVLGR